MKESLYFTYNGIKSTDMGVTQISLSNGLFEEEFVAPKNIIEEKIRGRDTPYFFGVERDPLSFSMGIYFDNGMDDDSKRKVKRWLDQDTYLPLIFSSNLSRIYYAMVVNDSKEIHNGLEEGYLQLQMRCDSPYAYSPTYYSKIYEFNGNASGTEIIIENNGDVECKPTIYIEKIGNGNVDIINQSNAGQTFSFTDLNDQEIVFVDCENEVIITDLIGQYRYDSFNDEYLTLVRGVNTLKIVGDLKLMFKYRFKFK
jgi:phage-related protein